MIELKSQNSRKYCATKSIRSDILVCLWLLSIRGLRSVVVITCASHAQGPQFDPGRRQFLFLSILYSPLLLKQFHAIDISTVKFAVLYT